jgi:hypothetical protein
MIAQLPNSTAGGHVIEDTFIRVIFQSGYAAEVGINGCLPQDVIRIAMNRLLEFQGGALACSENEEALFHLQAANAALAQRIQRRKEQGVLNTGKPHDVRRTEDEDDDFSATGA